MAGGRRRGSPGGIQGGVPLVDISSIKHTQSLPGSVTVCADLRGQ